MSNFLKKKKKKSEISEAHSVHPDPNFEILSFDCRCWLDWQPEKSRRYLLNIRLHQGDSLICAVQIFSHPDRLKMRERRGRGVCMDQLGQITVGEEIKNTITHTCTHKHTL